jgi:putative transposase
MLHELYPQRKRVRIAHDVYHTEGSICSISVATLDRRRIFENLLLTDACVDLLGTHANATGVPVYAYCFMPDHLHLLLSPTRSTSVFDFVRVYKSLSTRLAWQHEHAGRLWQARFYDHFLRKDDDVRRVVDYIVSNPVRAGIVTHWCDYPFCGSFVYEL